MRYLIVNDTPRARHSLKALLKVWNLVDESCEAENGAEALRLAEEYLPDIILMDARLPVMSGLEATRQIKAKWPQIKIIVLSFYSDYQFLAEEAGADGFFINSAPPEELRKMLLKIFPQQK